MHDIAAFTPRPLDGSGATGPPECWWWLHLVGPSGWLAAGSRLVDLSARHAVPHDVHVRRAAELRGPR